MRRYLLLLALALPACAQLTLYDLLAEKTLGRLREYDRQFDGALGVMVADVEGGRHMGLHSDIEFPQASVIKVPILATLFAEQRAGRIQFDAAQRIDAKELIGGSKEVKAALDRGAASMTVAELMLAMIRSSDNTATNKLIALVGMDRVNAFMTSLGFAHTRLRRKMLDAAAARRDDENISTPNEMSQLFEMIASGKLVDRKACLEMTGLLRQVEGGFQEGLPLDTGLAVKTGAIPGSRSETGIIFVKNRPFVLSVMSAFIDDRHAPVADVARIVWPWIEKIASSNRYGNRLE
jgi:beta-lactamase class A